jgi:hypothetical protein
MASDQFWKLRSTTACSGGVVSLLCSPSRGHTRGRIERGGEGGAPRRGEESTWLIAVYLSLPWGHFIVGKGVHLPFHQGTTRVAAKGRSKAAARVWWGQYTQTLSLAGWARAKGPRRPLPLIQYEGAHRLNGLPSGRGPLRWASYFYYLNIIYLILIHLFNINYLIPRYSETLTDFFERLLVFIGTIPSLFNQQSTFPDITKNHLKHP